METAVTAAPDQPCRVHIGSHCLMPYPVADPDHVDQRRAAHGLAPVADYICSLAQDHQR